MAIAEELLSYTVFDRRQVISSDSGEAVTFQPLPIPELNMDIITRISCVVRRYCNRFHQRPRHVAVGGEAARLLEEHPLTAHYRARNDQEEGLSLAVGPMVWGLEIRIDLTVPGVVAY